MSKIAEKLKQLKNSNEGFVSLEFFPPKTESGLTNLLQRIERLSVLKPLFVSITWGAGGSTAEKSLELAAYCQKELNLTVCLHLTCTNTNKEIIDNALAKAKESGIRNILALRGDPPRAEVLDDSIGSLNKDFQYAADLVRYIRHEHDDYFSIGVAAYPDGHVDGSDNSFQDFEKDIPYLEEKVKAGADFIISQLFFDVDQYLKFESKILSTESLANIPMIPGLIPINNYQLFKRVTKLSHATIPKSVLNRFPVSVQSDDRKVKEIGVEVLDEIISDLYKRSNSPIKGFHFYSLNLESSIAKLVKKSPILQEYTHIAADDTNAIVASEKDKSTSSAASEISNFNLSKKDILAISTGIGTLGKEATWDEFPNGRFGDSRSPAYGEIDGYGPSLKIPFGVKNPLSKELWGVPQNLGDIGNLFIDYLSKKIPALPFSDLEISAETLLIQEELFQVNAKNWFSLSSQPALNGCSSTDSIFGWGAKNGYLYQKSYIELLVSENDWKRVLKPKIDHYNESVDDTDSNCNKTISYYAGNAAKGVAVETNISVDNRSTAVTWGVFPNKEIVQSTIIEEQSFRAWKDEAFGILVEWANLYLIEWKNSTDADSKKYETAYKLIKSIHDEFYLITIFDNNFQDEDGLWSLLSE
ncbi:methylenetetrahydrofolate reductase (NAD(P)H) [Saccharomycopsis crataegensis]|uniref:Methylenetetrahydrofolate reductase (NAD(P)H) n=1 Tax=Saccharomycopsis crataegensis TaxID=43959 RepID=A0AAV5QGE3_9ASCO|nr:methylenetetrahydrofolate reductase (NAD(P)H) [Saccharomycopsis crataegensis]